MEGSGLTAVLLSLLGLVVAILWVLLPFAVFGIKDKLDEQTKQLKAINRTLTNINKEIGVSLKEDNA